jgi:cytochrome c
MSVRVGDDLARHFSFRFSAAQTRGDWVAGSSPAMTTIFVALLAVSGACAAELRSAGERAFQRCYACHSVVVGEDKLPGPNLHGVVGRRAGTLPTFEYSPAMLAAGRNGLVWTRDKLDAYLADPEAVVPGTAMAMPPLKDVRERAAVIDYLAGQK